MNGLEFWNNNNIQSLWFQTSTGGTTMTFNQLAGEDVDGEDYCDLTELLDPLLGGLGQLNTETLATLKGVEENGRWTWDGEGIIRDARGNDYTVIVLLA